MESCTNGGLILIKEKLEEIPNHFLQPTSFLNMILLPILKTLTRKNCKRMKYNDKQGLVSKEAKIFLKIQDCELAHIRNTGKIKFIKKGNAFLYDKESVEAWKNHI